MSTNSIASDVKKSAEALGAQLLSLGQKVTSAESCTGGGLAKAITAVAGSSQWFDCAFVSYSNSAKELLLGVNPEVIEKNGAVSVEVAEAMALGAAKRAQAQLGIATSGIAGPGGGTTEKPVGTVCLAWAHHGIIAHSEVFHFDGDREQVREQAIKTALQLACKLLL